MKKLVYLIGGLLLTLAFAALVVSMPHFWLLLSRWSNGWLVSEKYLLITSSWVLSQSVFPHFGIIQVTLLYLFAIVGFFVCLAFVFRVLRPMRSKIPLISFKKETLFALFTIVLVSFFIGLILCLIELSLSRKSDGADILLGDKLTPVSTWHQQVAADERGMCYMRQDFAWWDTLHHVNRQGFLSDIDYTKETVDSLRKRGKTIVLVIGDSFVEGFTSGSWGHTFGQLIKKDLQDKYAIFTFGIGGTDPLDYRLRIEKFVPELKPDLVLVCFCGNNDIMDFDRRPVSYVPILWTVNETFFYSNLYNKVILPTPDSLSHYLRNNTATKRASSPWMKWMCGKSSLISYTYSVLHPWLPVRDDQADTCTAAYRNLLLSQKVCDRDSVPFEILFIPDKKNLQDGIADYQKKYQGVFKGLLPMVVFPSGFTKNEFGEGNDIHFNDTGNRNFANFLEGRIANRKK
jgi:lysophospholipase L1-like esterase